MEITIKQVKPKDQIQLSNGITEIVKTISKTKKTKDYFDIKTSHNVFEVHKDTKVNLILRP